ncbi:hypothetical protein TB1_007106 [Malus domestica]
MTTSPPENHSRCRLVLPPDLKKKLGPQAMVIWRTPIPWSRKCFSFPPKAKMAANNSVIMAVLSPKLDHHFFFILLLLLILCAAPLFGISHF